MTTHYLSLFDYLENINLTDINFDDYCHIPSVKYRNHIADFCKNLSKIKDITGYGCTLMLPNGMMCFISNKPFMHITYASSGIERANSYFIKAYNFPETHFFFTKNKEQKIDLLENAMTQFLEKKLKVYNTYCLIRRTDDCTAIIGTGHDYPTEDPHMLYTQTVEEIENFTINFLDQFLNIYIDNLPLLKHTRFATDKLLRTKVIKQRKIDKKPEKLLTQRETECLHWASRGKTSAEIAILMQISELTVTEHKKSIMQKLNACNMTHAVREAIHGGIIA